MHFGGNRNVRQVFEQLSEGYRVRYPTGYRDWSVVERELVAPAMPVAGGVTLGWLLAGGPDGPWLGVEPIYPGLALAALFAAVGWGPARRTSRSDAPAD